MANYKLVDSDKLDADLTSVADSIRAKGGTSGKLKFPSEMVSAISEISTGVTVKRKTGSVTTNNDGSATVNCGFIPDLVFVTLNETTNEEYNQSVTLLFDESPDTGYCNSLMWSNDNEGNAEYLCDMWGKQTSNGFQFNFNWIHITTWEPYGGVDTFHYVAIKYT